MVASSVDCKGKPATDPVGPASSAGLTSSERAGPDLAEPETGIAGYTSRRNGI